MNEVIRDSICVVDSLLSKGGDVVLVGHVDGGVLGALHKAWEGVADKMGMVLVIYFLVLFAVLVDLYTGIRRARLQGLARTSRAYRRTVNKVNRYYSLLLIASFIDMSCLLVSAWEQVGVLSMPYMTWLGGVGLCLIELRSVWENTRGEKGKDDIEETARVLAKAVGQVRDPERLVDTMLKYINAGRDKGEERGV